MPDKPKLNFVKDNTVNIYGEFDNSVSTEILPEFRKLIEDQSKLKEGKIVINISSNGGYLYILSELLALVKDSQNKGVIIETRAMSDAMSCGALLLMSGNKGHRYASQFSNILIHHSTAWIVSSTDKQMDRAVKMRKHFDNLIRKFIEEKTSIPAKVLDEMLSDDNYYIYGNDLKKYSIVDEVV